MKELAKKKMKELVNVFRVRAAFETLYYTKAKLYPTGVLTSIVYIHEVDKRDNLSRIYPNPASFHKISKGLNTSVKLKVKDFKAL